ncbi:hypothetical protein DIPPA_15072 [Diplonema papillatum]|nr:hypothetical protein DIPPA_15072 [Diplonema papillatum]
MKRWKNAARAERGPAGGLFDEEETMVLAWVKNASGGTVEAVGAAGDDLCAALPPGKRASRTDLVRIRLRGSRKCQGAVDGDVVRVYPGKEQQDRFLRAGDIGSCPPLGDALVSDASDQRSTDPQSKQPACDLLQHFVLIRMPTVSAASDSDFLLVEP